MNFEVSDLLKALGEPSRLRMASLLQGFGECCSCDLERVLHQSQPNISQHMAKLRAAGLVEGRKQGTWIHYRLVPAVLEDHPFLRVLLEEALASPAGREDRKNFEASRCCGPNATGLVPIAVRGEKNGFEK